MSCENTHKNIRFALYSLLTACEAADARGELAEEVNGDLLDAARDALSSFKASAVLSKREAVNPTPTPRTDVVRRKLAYMFGDDGRPTTSEDVAEALDHAETLENELTTAVRDRDLAIAHDSQPYPTAHAYEKVCEALNSLRASLPRLWDAESIGGAPGDSFRIGELVNGEWRWDRWREQDKDFCLHLLKINGSAEYLRFFGPIPQPPIKEWE